MVANQIKFKRLLVIAPHPDDEVLGCGGTIIKAVKNGLEVIIVYLTSGDSKQKLREKEAIKVCKYLKINESYFLRLHEKGLNASLENIKRIVKVFKRTQPDIVFINHDQDGDKEHQISYQLATEAVWRYNAKAGGGRQINGVLLYEIHKPMQNYNLVEDISSVIKQKMLAMSFYKTQLNNSKVDLAVQGLNRYRGSIHEGVDFAEVFQIKRWVSLFS